MKYIYLVFSLIILNNFSFGQCWQWAKKGGGDTLTDGNEAGNAVKTDPMGNVYITGTFHKNANFGGISINSSGADDAFVAKYDSLGNIGWVKKFGGMGLDHGYDLALDSTGNIYVTGMFSQTAQFGGNTLTSSGGSDIFILKLDPSGNALWVKKAGSTNGDWGKGISVDPIGNVYATGTFQDSVLFGTFKLKGNGGSEVFVVKHDPQGNFLWAKTAMGSPSQETGNDICFGTQGEVYVIGGFFGDIRFDTVQVVTGNNYEYFFLAKFDKDGNTHWVRTAPGSLVSRGEGVEFDYISNTVYITGSFNGNPVFGNFPLSGSDYSIFIARYKPNGTVLFAKGYQSSSGATGTEISIDKRGNCYFTGKYNGITNIGTMPFPGSGGFVAKLNPIGNLVWAKRFGDMNTKSLGISTFRNDDVYISGGIRGAVNFGPANLTGTINSDVFLAKMSNFKISGKVYNDSNLVTSGSVFLLKKDFKKRMKIIDSVAIKNGNYLFSNASDSVPHIIFVKPDKVNYPQLHQTFYSKTIRWDSADVINFSCDTLKKNLNLQIIELPPLSGNGKISGKVVEGIGFERSPGDPIPGIDITLEQNPGGIISTSTTDSTGKYEFAAVPEGDYTITASIPGLPADSSYDVKLDSSNSEYSSQNFYANDSSVTIDSTIVTSNKLRRINKSLSTLRAYPNPFNEYTIIEFGLKKTEKVGLIIYNILGKTIYETPEKFYREGTHTFKFDPEKSGNSEGIYLGKLKLGEEVKFFKVTKIN